MSNSSSSSRDSHGAIIRSTSILSLGTLVSRVLGFIRDIILAKLLGTGLRADALYVAFRIPNLLRNFVGEGATNSAVVPVFSEYLEKKERPEVWQVMNVVFVFALMILSALTLAGIIFSPLIVRIIAPGFLADPEKLELTVRLTRIIFPYLLFIGLTAYSMAVLYTFRSFAAPAFSPCFLNIAIIAGSFVSVRFLKEPVYGLAVSILVGGMLQLAVQLPSMMRLGIKWEWPRNLRHPGAAHVGQLLLPRLVGAGVYQLNVVVDTFCASLAAIVGAGGISAIYYANRIIQFPMGVFTIALASASLPTLSTLASKGDLVRMRETLKFALEDVIFVMLPMSLVMVGLAFPMIQVLFERGQFDRYSTVITSSALLFYGLGLMSFGGIQILVTSFYALKDTKTPVKIAIVCVAVNAILNFALMGPLKVGGIALASSISATLNFCLLWAVLGKRIGGLRVERIFISKILGAMCVAGVLLWLLWAYLPFAARPFKLFLVMGCAFGAYGGVCYGLRVEPARQLGKWLSRRIKF